jgi:hypothetical protein
MSGDDCESIVDRASAHPVYDAALKTNLLAVGAFLAAMTLFTPIAFVLEREFGVPSLFVLPVVAVTLGHVAKRQIDRAEGRQKGRTLAVAGLVIGWLQLLGIVLMIAFFLLLFATSDDLL